MSMRCLIGRKLDNNKVEYIYCHHDGYLYGVRELVSADQHIKELQSKINELNAEISTIKNYMK